MGRVGTTHSAGYKWEGQVHLPIIDHTRRCDRLRSCTRHHCSLHHCMDCGTRVQGNAGLPGAPVCSANSRVVHGRALDIASYTAHSCSRSLNHPFMQPAVRAEAASARFPASPGPGDHAPAYPPPSAVSSIKPPSPVIPIPQTPLLVPRGREAPKRAQLLMFSVQVMPQLFFQWTPGSVRSC